jgi:hypothetical protein
MYNGLKIHDLILKFLEQRKALHMTWIAHYYDAYEHFSFAWRSTQAHTAAYFGHEDLVVSYLRTGQPMDMTDSTGETPLMYAVRAGNVKTTKILLDSTFKS